LVLWAVIPCEVVDMSDSDKPTVSIFRAEIVKTKTVFFCEMLVSIYNSIRRSVANQNKNINTISGSIRRPSTSSMCDHRCARASVNSVCLQFSQHINFSSSCSLRSGPPRWTLATEYLKLYHSQFQLFSWKLCFQAFVIYIPFSM
jgi:hypothetical protein